MRASSSPVQKKDACVIKMKNHEVRKNSRGIEIPLGRGESEGEGIG